MKAVECGTAIDNFLEERMKLYDQWLEEGKIPTSSKVIPVHKALQSQQWVLYSEQVFEFLRNARSFALTDCVCRAQYQRCDNPLRTCFLINDAADQEVQEGRGQYATLDEARQILKQANERGLIHLTIYNPEQHVYAVCSCCPCCCHDLQFLKLYGRTDMVAHSDYISETDMALCTHCGDCIERCIFEARLWENGEMAFNASACYGCGLCVEACPTNANVMRLREEVTRPK